MLGGSPAANWAKRAWVSRHKVLINTKIRPIKQFPAQTAFNMWQQAGLTKLGQLLRDLQLLLAGEGSPRGLLAVSQGGVEDANVVGVVYSARDVLRPLGLLLRGRGTHRKLPAPTARYTLPSTQHLQVLGTHNGRHLGLHALFKLGGFTMRGGEEAGSWRWMSSLYTAMCLLSELILYGLQQRLKREKRHLFFGAQLCDLEGAAF